MPIHLHSHLHRNRYGVYGFRIIIPKDLQVSCGKSELRKSLRTNCLTKAKCLAYRYTLLTNTYFDKIRNSSSIEEALATGREFIDALSRCTDFDGLTERLATNLPEPTGEHAYLLHGLISARDRSSATQKAKKRLLKNLVSQLAEKPESEWDSLFCDMYEELLELDTEQNRINSELNDLTIVANRVILGVLHKNEVSALHKVQEAEIGNITDIAAEIAAKATLRATSVGIMDTKALAPPNPKSELLSTTVDAYCNNQISEGSWTLKTEAENRAIFALWLRIVGDQPIREYGFERHRDYKATITKLPANLNKNPRFRNKEIAEILSLNCPPAAPNTVNKNLVRISALFDWAIKYGYTELNPASGMTIKNPKRANEERQAFTDDDLSKLFNSPEYTLSSHRHPYQFWVPLIALYTGARLNEICQLHLCDLDDSDGVKILKITTEGGRKRLKTKAARRYIPLHPELMRLGLIEYAEQLAHKGNNRLFPELEEGRDGYGRAVTKWFAAYATRCGVDSPGKVFHSFRHTFINRLKQAEVPKEIIAALVGHEDTSITFGRYGKEFKPDIMLSAIKKIDLQFSKKEDSE